MKKTSLLTSLCLSTILITPFTTQTLTVARADTLNSYTYTPTQKSISMNGTPVNQPYGIVANGTTYMPIWYVMQALNQLGIVNTWNGSAWSLTAPTSMTANLANIDVTSGSDIISLNNTPVQRVDGIADTDPASGQPTTYMPIWYVMQILNRLNITSAWNGSAWSLTSSPGNSNSASTSTSNVSQGAGSASSNTSSTSSTSSPSNAATKKIVLAWTVDTNSETDAEIHANSVNEIGDDSFTINADGTIAGTATPSFISAEHSHGNTVFATVQNYDSNGFDAQLMENIFASPTLTEALENNLVNLAVQNSYDGINLDIESLHATDEAAFTSFVAGLHAKLGAVGKLLNVALPAETATNGVMNDAWDDAYNYTAIGQNADMVSIMTYDYTWINQPPGPIAPLEWDNQVMDYATSVIPSSKILLGIGAYGYDWPQTGDASGMTLKDIQSLITQDNITPSWDATDSVPYFTYTADGTLHTVYYENQQSLTDKMDLAEQDHLAGIAVWRLGSEDPDFWNAIATYLQ